jgi:hypothetical protein
VLDIVTPVSPFRRWQKQFAQIGRQRQDERPILTIPICRAAAKKHRRGREQIAKT